MSFARPAGESDCDSADDDELYEFVPMPAEKTDASNRNRMNVEDHGVKACFNFPRPPAPTTSGSSAAAVKQSDPTILHDMQTAISTGNTNVVEKLLGKLGNPNALLKSDWPLIVHAAYFCHYSIVELLLKHGADVSAINDTGDTALHACCKSGTNPGSESVIKTASMLVSSGANVDAKDFSGRTPLMYACRRNLGSIVKFFLGFGNSHERVFVKDDRDWNCIDWCAIFGNLKALEVIISTLQITIDPKRYSSSKFWPNHVFEFLQHPHQITKTDHSTTDDQEMKECDAGGDAAEAVDPQKSSKEIAVSGIVAMDTVALDRGPMTTSFSPNDQSMEKVPYGATEVHDVEMTTENAESSCFQDGMEDDDEEYILPTVIKRDTGKVEEYQTYGHLELFLAGLELSHLIPLFQKQDIKFDELLCLSMDELEKIGIKAYGTRKRILSAIQECHDKHTSTSSLPDYTKTPLTTNNMFRMMDGSAEQIDYIASCMRYIKYHIGEYPDTLYPDANVAYEKPPLQTHHDKIDGITRSLVNLARSLDGLKSQADDFERATCPELTQPVGLATLENMKDSGQRARMKRLFAISIAVMAFYIWRKSSLYSA